MSRTYWIARALRSFGYAGLIVCGCFLFIQFLNGSTEPAPKACADDFDYCCGPVLEAPAVLALIFFVHFWGWLLVLAGINVSRAFEFLRRSRQNPLETRELPAAVSATPHFMENRNWGKTLPVLSRPFLGEFLMENQPVSRLGWIGRTVLSGIGILFFSWLTIVTAQIGAKEGRPFFDGFDGCEPGPVIYVPPTYDMDAFFNYTLFVVFLGITIVLIGQTRDFLQNARLAQSNPVPPDMETRA